MSHILREGIPIEISGGFTQVTIASRGHDVYIQHVPSIRVHETKISDHTWSTVARLGIAREWFNGWRKTAFLVPRFGFLRNHVDCLLVGLLSIR